MQGRWAWYALRGFLSACALAGGPRTRFFSPSLAPSLPPSLAALPGLAAALALPAPSLPPLAGALLPSFPATLALARGLLLFAPGLPG